MKKIVPLLLTALFSLQAFSQSTIRIANNNPGAVTGTNVYTGSNALQDAIDAAASGDIIHVIPSPDDYGDALIDDKSLTIIGVGLNPTRDIGNLSLIDEIRLDNAGASGTRVSGVHVGNFYVAINTATPHTISNILFENSEVRRIVGAGFGPGSPNSISNFIIRNCVVNSQNNTGDAQGFELYNAVGVIIENNLIKGRCCVAGSVQGDGLTVQNNLFFDYTNGVSFHSIQNSVVRNNIFLNSNPSIGSGSTGNTFQNNISFNTTSDAFVTGVNGNTGSGNLEGVDPMLTNVPETPGDWNYSYDFTPMAGSPVLNAGTDGTDIGPTGGANPFNTEGTLLPVIQSLTLPSVISQGTDLEVNIKAKGN